MRLTFFVAALVVAGVAAGVCPVARAQSLGDVSRKEEERRKDVKSPAKVYTNKDLGGPAANSIVAEPGAKPATPPAPLPPAAKPDDKAKDGPAKDQAYWAGRKKDLAAKLERDKVLADAMQSRINGLNTDFSARSDPAQRSVIERDRQRAFSELNSLQQAIKDDQKALSDLDEEARKAAVPPGWLR